MRLPDIVCPVGISRSSEDLRYTLRAAEENVLHENVWLVGYRPGWVSNEAEHIEFEPQKGRWENTSDALLLACENVDVSDPFLYFNDDMFALKYNSSVAWDKGLLEDTLRRDRGGRVYRESGEQTYRLLLSGGFSRPKDYELHIPMLIHKEVLVRAVAHLREADLSEAYKRTVYGNMLLGETETREDVKLYGLHSDELWSDWISTSDEAFSSGEAGRRIRKLFPNPSLYEW